MKSSIGSESRGILCALLAYFFTTSLRVIAKYLSTDLGIAEIVFFRNCFGLLPLLIILKFYRREALDSPINKLGMIRLSACALLSMTAIFTSYKFLDPVSAESIIFTAPIFVVIYSRIRNKASIDYLRSFFMSCGFIGTLLVLRPWSSGVGIISIIPLIAASLSAMVSLLMVEINKTEQPLNAAVWFSIQMAIMGAPMIFFNWVTPSFEDLVLLVAMGIFAGLAQYLLILAYKYADATIVTPFQYSSLIWAFLYGFLIWGEIPNLTAFVGGVLIVISGFLIARKEIKT